MRRALVSLGILAWVGVTACSTGDGVVTVPAPGGPGPNQPDPDVPGPGGSPPPASASIDAAWVFDEAVVRTYRVTLEPAAWDALRASAREETYVAADLEVEGHALPNVGLRFKGGFGSLEQCFDEAGAMLCPKLSMKLKFDEFAPEQRLGGLKRLNFNAVTSDPSLMHERLGYALFRDMGVAAPRAVHARLVVNGELLGVFSLVEQIDGRFTDDRFAGGDGNLYKEQWPDTEDLETVGEHLTTNEDTPDHSGMLEFHAALRDAAPEALPSVLERYVEVEPLFRYVAVDRAIRNWDGITAFYCSEYGCYNHNYYFYQHEGEPRFTLIPWDLDNTFSVATAFEAVPGPLEIPSDCSVRYPVFPDVTVQAPACDPLLRALASSDGGRYTAALSELLDGPFADGVLEARIDALAAQLAPAVAEDVYGPGLEAFELAVAELRGDVALLRARLSAEREGQPVPRFTLAVEGRNDFEAVTPLGLELGATTASAPETRFDVALDAEAALDGVHDLRLDFEFRDGPAAWSQWARLDLPLSAALGADLSSTTTLRLVVRADGPRTLRVSFDSYAYTAPETGATLGWDVVLDGSVQELELPLATAAFPDWAPPVPETPGDVLRRVRAVLFDPLPEGRDDAGFLGADVRDRGQIHIDDIELVR